MSDEQMPAFCSHFGQKLLQDLSDNLIFVSSKEVAMTALISLVWYCTLAQVYVLVAATILPHDLIQGSPRYSWLMSLPLQGVLMPGLALHAWLASELSIEAWLSAPYESLPCQACQDAFVYAFVCYMLKDVFVGMTLTFWLHHLISAAVGVYFLQRSGSGTFILVASILEAGSATNTIYTLWPKSTKARRAHAVGMTTSNVFAAYLGLDRMINSNKSLGIRALLSLVLAGFIVCRQKHCLQSLQTCAK